MHLPADFSTALGLQRKAGPVTTLHIFDFDGTLVRTPGPVEGKPRYEKATGKPWKGGWWGRTASLTPPVLKSPCPSSLVIDTVFDELEQVVTRSQTSVAVVVTGRISHLRKEVLRVLDEVAIGRKNDTVPKGQSFLHHDAVFTHPGGNMSTLQFKTALFKHFLTSGPLAKLKITQLHIWEDRKEHAEVFATEFTEQLYALTGVKTTVHLITPDTP